MADPTPSKADARGTRRTSATPRTSRTQPAPPGSAKAVATAATTTPAKARAAAARPAGRAAKAPATKTGPATKTPATKTPTTKTSATKAPGRTRQAPPAPPTAAARTRGAATRTPQPESAARASATTPRRSPVEQLLADQSPTSPEQAGAQPGPGAASDAASRTSDTAARADTPSGQDPAAQPASAQSSAQRSATARPAGSAMPPPIQDVALGLAAVIAETLWRAGAVALTLATAASARALTVARAIAPAAAGELTEAAVLSLADRGRRLRAARMEELTDLLTGAMADASASPALREIAVSAIGEAAEEVLAVVLPSLLDAMSEEEHQERLDELMAGLLVRQMPAALERTLPGVMLRTATKPALGIVPSVMGALRPS